MQLESAQVPRGETKSKGFQTKDFAYDGQDKRRFKLKRISALAARRYPVILSTPVHCYSD